MKIITVMKLELKYLTPYLPYGLRFYDAIHGITHNIVGVIENEIYAKDDNGDCYSWYYEELDELPILRPLSDLTKDITNGNDIINFQQFFNQYDFEWLITSNNKMKLINSMDYFIVNKLFEWHFDVFNLRENDLCIYYNEL